MLQIYATESQNHKTNTQVFQLKNFSEKEIQILKFLCAYQNTSRGKL